MRAKLWQCAWLTALLAASLVDAADSPQVVVRASLDPAKVTIGETATLTLDIFTDTFFLAAPELPALSIPGVVAKLSDERPVHMNEQIGGTTMFGIRRNYQLTPIAAATFEIPSFSVITHPGPGTSTVTTPVRALHLTAAGPPGAEGAFVTRELSITQRVDADPSTLKVGDAFTRTIEVTAVGTPAMFIPDISLSEVDGLASYPQAPVLHDTDPDQPVIGRRVFSVNYVVQKAVDAELPAISIAWWSLKTRAAATAQVPAIKVHAVAAPAPTPAFELPPDPSAASARKRINWHLVISTSGAAILLIALAWWLSPYLIRGCRALHARHAARRAAYLDSERHAFQELESALRTQNAERIPPALYRWLDRMPMADTPAPTVKARGDREFIESCEQVLAQRYGNGGPLSREAIVQLQHSVRSARRRLLRKAVLTHADQQPLPKLNPL